VKCPECGAAVCPCGTCHECELEELGEEEEDDEERGNGDDDFEEASP
jgi:hypothetical protein